MIIEEKIKLILLSLFNVLFIGVFSYIFIDTVLHSSQVFATMNWWIVLLLAMMGLFVLYVTYGILSRLSKKLLIIFSCFDFLVLIGLQVFLKDIFK
ncbi:MAG: hypothetical protein Q3980_15110 [Turicibacter sp.]|nr:hypothetical protein [Turicibacter sp.]